MIWDVAKSLGVVLVAFAAAILIVFALTARYAPLCECGNVDCGGECLGGDG